MEYLEGVTDKQKVKGMGGVGLDGSSSGDEDDLLGEAQEIIINAGKASASLLQRRLSVGYARAARILDELEDRGVIGPSNGAKPREILITKEEYIAASEQPMAGVSLHRKEEFVAPEEFLGNSADEENGSGTVFLDNNQDEEENAEDIKNDVFKKEQEQKTDSQQDKTSDEENDEEEDDDEMFFSK